MASPAASLSRIAHEGAPAKAARPDLVLRETTSAEMAGNISAWDGLAACASEPNPFFESWYLLPAIARLDTGHHVRFLRFEAGGELAGLLPVVRPARYYRWPLPHLASWLHANCFLGAPLVATGLEREFWRALLAWADARAGTALFLHLGLMPLEGPLHAALAGVLEEQARTGGPVYREERAMLSSPQTPEAYFEAALSGKKRKELRRQFARLSEMGEARFERRTDAADLERWTDRFLALEAAGWKGAAGSALAGNAATAAVFRASLDGAARRGKLERLALSLDGEPIAMLATFLAPPGAYAFKTAFDERYARFSPGVLLQRENLSILNRDDIAWSDSCAAADHPMIDHIWRERRAIGHLSIAIGGHWRRALFRRLLRAELGRNPKGISA